MTTLLLDLSTLTTWERLKIIWSILRGRPFTLAGECGVRSRKLKPVVPA